MTELKDIAGNVIEPGDTVVYPQMSGRSVQMVLGELVSYNGKTAQIQRIEGTRWSAGYQRTKYRDKRTGLNIDIWSSSGEHWEAEPYSTYKHQVTGEEISQEELDRRYPLNNWGAWNNERYKYGRTYHPGVHKDYVEKYQDPLKPVTIQKVENIVKVVPHGA